MEERTIQHRIYRLERLIDLLSHFRSRQDNLPTHEDQKHDLRLHHPIDQAREQFGLVTAEVMMLGRKTFETNRELDITRPNDVLDLEIRELGIKPQFLDDAGVLAAGKFAVILGFGTSDDHFPGGEDQGGSFGVADPHDHGGETLLIRVSTLKLKGLRRHSIPLDCTLRFSRAAQSSSGLTDNRY